jgi:hypothetical protein
MSWVFIAGRVHKLKPVRYHSRFQNAAARRVTGKRCG